jgi:hypothetical protein
LSGKTSARNSGTVKLVATRPRLFANSTKIFRNCRHGRLRLAKANQLRVMPVTPGCSSQDGLRKQTFAPDSHEAGSIQVFRVQAPDSHAGKISFARCGNKTVLLQGVAAYPVDAGNSGFTGTSGNTG